jgi:hypothetical protein
VRDADRDGDWDRIGTGMGLGCAPMLGRFGVDAGIARAAADRDSGSRRASAVRRGQCELAQIHDAPSVCVSLTTEMRARQGFEVGMARVDVELRVRWCEAQAMRGGRGVGAVDDGPGEDVEGAGGSRRMR